MTNKLTIILITFTFFTFTLQSIDDNNVDDSYVEAVSQVLKEKNVNDLGGMIKNFMSSEGGKQMGDMLMGAAMNNGDATTNQILQGLGSLLKNNGKEGGGFDPAIIGNVLSALNTGSNKSSKKNEGGFDPSILGNLLGAFANGNNGQGGADMGSLLSMFGGLLNQNGDEGDAPGLMSYLPMLMQSFSSFVGPEADHRAEQHADHAWLLPPMLEQIHLWFDHFRHSEIGRAAMATLGAEKFVKVFADKDGNLSYERFVELIENHSFRRHWIQMITQRVASFVSYFADPKAQKKFLTSVQYFVNNFLKSQGFPKTALFEPTSPIESITALINHGFKRYFSYKVNSKHYVKPAVEYIQELMRLGQQKGYLLGTGIDSRQLSNKLADTINLEIIEPVVRVNRASRFANKNPKCDRYVMCLVNQPDANDQLSLPGLKSLLSKGASIIASWFLSGNTGTSFWSLYHIIMEENNCQARFLEECNGFHIEELKVTTEYVHNEL